MKFALVEGRRCEAEPGLLGKCPRCGSTMVPKCGERRRWHWAHRGLRHCDRWSEPETAWHRDWKNSFPTEWQEVVHHAEDGEKHIADIKTEHGWVIEFQYSYLKPEERRAREAFYGSMSWIVDGLRRIRDKPGFYEALRERQLCGLKPLTYRVPLDGCALLLDWANSRVSVFFDFGSTQEDIGWFGVRVLWHLSPKSEGGWALLTPVPVVNFLDAFLKGVPIQGIHVNAAQRRAKMPAAVPGLSRLGRRRAGPESFEQYLARKHRERSRRRL